MNHIQTEGFLPLPKCTEAMRYNIESDDWYVQNASRYTSQTNCIRAQREMEWWGGQGTVAREALVAPSTPTLRPPPQYTDFSSREGESHRWDGVIILISVTSGVGFFGVLACIRCFICCYRQKKREKQVKPDARRAQDMGVVERDDPEEGQKHVTKVEVESKVEKPIEVR